MAQKTSPFQIGVAAHVSEVPVAPQPVLEASDEEHKVRVLAQGKPAEAPQTWGVKDVLTPLGIFLPPHIRFYGAILWSPTVFTIVLTPLTH